MFMALLPLRRTVDRSAVLVGGAYIAGAVRVKVKALQITVCKQTCLERARAYRSHSRQISQKVHTEERKRKEIQLGVNVEESSIELARTASQEMRLRPCK